MNTYFEALELHSINMNIYLLYFVYFIAIKNLKRYKNIEESWARLFKASLA